MSTIADVAQAAGVSISTVSYVMSGKRAISQETRERVEPAIDNLGFRPTRARAPSPRGRPTSSACRRPCARASTSTSSSCRSSRAWSAGARAGVRHPAARQRRRERLGRAAKGSMVDALLVMDVESDDPRIETLTRLDHPERADRPPRTGARSPASTSTSRPRAARRRTPRRARTPQDRADRLAAEVMARHTSYADRLARGFLDACEANGVVGTVSTRARAAPRRPRGRRGARRRPGDHRVLRAQRGRAAARRRTPGGARPARAEQLVGRGALPRRRRAGRCRRWPTASRCPPRPSAPPRREMICDILAGSAKPTVRLLPPALTGPALLARK